MIETFVSFIPSIASVLGWTILHSIWQILLIAAILKLLLWGVSRYAASIRYNLSVLALVAVFICSTYTFWVEWNQHQTITNQLENIVLIELLDTSNSNDEIAKQSPGYFDQWSSLIAPITPYLAIFWMLGMFFFSSRMLVGLIRLHTFSRKGIHEIPMDWQIRFEALKRKSGIWRNVDVYLSDLIAAPITYKFFRPIILLPVSVFTGLSDEQIEVLLLHELAHIKRHDYLVNLLQSVIEILFFYHPLIWWISKNVRAEREHCCDDKVLNLRNQPMLYAQTLTQIQSQHYSFKTHLAMSANGNKGAFTQRIFRLFKEQETPSQSKNSAIALMLLILSGMMMAFYPMDAQSNLKSTPPSDVITQDTLPEEPAKIKALEEVVLDEIVVVGFEKKKSIEEEVFIEDGKLVEIIYEDDTMQIIEITDLEEEIGEIEIIDEEFADKEEIIIEEIEEPIMEESYQSEPIEIEEEEVRISINKGGELLTAQLKKGAKPLVYLDNKVFTDWTIDDNGKITINIPVDEVKIVNVYKGSEKSPSDHSGDVIEIFSFDSKAEPIEKDKASSAKEPLIRIRKDTTPNSDKPLFVIDGVISDRDNIDEEISPDDILSISVLKGNSAFEKYGEDGENGVVEITTKGNKIKEKKKKKIKKKRKEKKKAKKKKKVKEKKEKKKSKKLAKSLESLNEFQSVVIEKPQLSISPNPTNQRTNIKVMLEEKDDIRLEVYDIRGQLISVIVDKKLDNGTHDYEWDSTEYPAGTYIVKLTTSEYSITNQLIVNK